MNLVLLGAPGSGKGTQAELVSKKYNMEHISTGDVFREILDSDHYLKEEIEKYITKGLFVPDEIVMSIVREKIDNQLKNFLLDGFPRNRIQTEMLDKYLSSKNSNIDFVIYLELSLEKGIERSTARRICPACNSNYNLVSKPPANDELCDKCNNKLIQRTDDQVDTVKERLRIYETETLTLVDYYRGQKKLLQINADNNIEQVFEDICQALDSSLGSPNANR